MTDFAVPWSSNVTGEMLVLLLLYSVVAVAVAVAAVVAVAVAAAAVVAAVVFVDNTGNDVGTFESSRSKLLLSRRQFEEFL